MYSEEIQKLLELRNYYVSVKEYIQIIKSPQINYVKYDNELFYISTADGYNFILKLKENLNG